jgi:hypothetical protein
MGDLGVARAVSVALHCYPKRWRDRHGAEAAELAQLLADDGVPVASVAFSYLSGAVRERLAPLVGGCGRGRAAAVLATASVAAAVLAMSASSAPAGALGVIRVEINHKPDAVAELTSQFRVHHFAIAVSQVQAPAGQAGSIVAIRVARPEASPQIIGEIRGPCAGGSPGCVVGLVIPANFTGPAAVFVGRV